MAASTPARRYYRRFGETTAGLRAALFIDQTDHAFFPRAGYGLVGGGWTSRWTRARFRSELQPSRGLWTRHQELGSQTPRCSQGRLVTRLRHAGLRVVLSSAARFTFPPTGSTSFPGASTHSVACNSPRVRRCWNRRWVGVSTLDQDTGGHVRSPPGPTQAGQRVSVRLQVGEVAHPSQAEDPRRRWELLLQPLRCSGSAGTSTNNEGASGTALREVQPLLQQWLGQRLSPHWAAAAASLAPFRRPGSDANRATSVVMSAVLSPG